MSGNSLHLDGVASFYGACVRYRDTNCIKEHLLSRIVLIVQAFLLVATNTCKQVVRGFTCIFSGNAKLFEFGVKDLVSAFIQLIALPILGIIAIFSPTSAMHCAQKLQGRYNRDCKIHNVSETAQEGDKKLQRVLLPYFAVSQTVDEKEVTTCFKFLACATASIQAVVYVIQGLVESLLAFDFGFEQFAFPILLLGAPIKCTFNFSPDSKILLDISATHVHGFNIKTPEVAASSAG